VARLGFARAELRSAPPTDRGQRHACESTEVADPAGRRSNKGAEEVPCVNYSGVPNRVKPRQRRAPYLAGVNTTHSTIIDPPGTNLTAFQRQQSRRVGGAAPDIGRPAASTSWLTAVTERRAGDQARSGPGSAKATGRRSPRRRRLDASGAGGGDACRLCTRTGSRGGPAKADGQRSPATPRGSRLPPPLYNYTGAVTRGRCPDRRSEPAVRVPGKRRSPLVFPAARARPPDVGGRS
jgi:hypothetical protein